jgi:oligopeptidase B
VAIAHVRGGGWLGRAWAEAGRGAARKARVSVADLSAAADMLVARGACARGRLALAGASAGGWLVGGALAARPGLAAAAVLTVPCLDPLEALVRHKQGSLEWIGAEEHGGGAGGNGDGDGDRDSDSDSAAAAVAALAGWSPYQHLEALAAAGIPAPGATEGGDLPGPPHLLLRAALHDRDVGFWDAAKATARLRRLRAAAAGDGRGPRAAEPMLLLRTVPGSHGAYEGDTKEAALGAAFLVEALAGQGQLLAALSAGAAEGDGGWGVVDWL